VETGIRPHNGRPPNWDLAGASQLIVARFGIDAVMRDLTVSPSPSSITHMTIWRCGSRLSTAERSMTASGIKYAALAAQAITTGSLTTI